MHRPSPATAISLAALVFAMSGTAYAATGGDFLLGKANTASSVSSLTNTKGTALSLSSTATSPPLKVSNSVQVPSLNASELDGQTSSAFLPTNGTAANSSALGGKPPTDYLSGGGQIAFDTATVADGGSAGVSLPAGVSSDYSLTIGCNSDGQAVATLDATGVTLQWWALAAGQAVDGELTVGQSFPVGGTTITGTWVLQVAFGSTMATTDLSMSVNTNGTCIFAAQTTANG